MRLVRFRVSIEVEKKMPTSPPVLPGFNLGVTAGMYSTLAGVLAGFSFAGIITIATFKPDKSSPAIPPDQAGEVRAEPHVGLFKRLLNAITNAPARPDEERQPGSLEPTTGPPFALLSRVLAASFLGLIVVSLSYASLSGSSYTAGSEVSEEMILGPAFAASAVQVFYAIVLLTEILDVPYFKDKEVALPIRRIVARWATVLAVFFVFDSMRDYETLRYHGNFTFITLSGVIFAGLQLIVSLVLYPYWAGERKYLARDRMTGWKQPTKDRTVRRLTSTAFTLTVVCGLCYAAFDAFSNESTMIWPVVPVILMFLVWLTMAYTTFQLARSGNTRSSEASRAS